MCGIMSVSVSADDTSIAGIKPNAYTSFPLFMLLIISLNLALSIKQSTAITVPA